MNKCLKILISAYACEPNKGSEPGVGWEYAKNLATMGEVWVVTRANNRQLIERELSELHLENLHIIYIDLPYWLRFWKSGVHGMYLYYLLWQIYIFMKVRKLHKRHCFDVFHHLTFGNLWLPTFIPLINIPFIWGPLGGGEKISWSFVKKFSFSGMLKECIRTFLISTLRINPFFYFAVGKLPRSLLKQSRPRKAYPISINIKL